METLDGSHSTQRGESMRREEAGQCFANETAISNENKRCQSRAESSGLSGFPGDRGSLITVWLEVRVLPGPPRSPMRTDVSRSLRDSPQFAGVSAGSNADVRSLPLAEVARASILAAGLWAR